MAFPASIDSPKFNWLPGETRSNHANQHNLIGTLLIALQTKIGTTGSLDTSSIQYFVDHHDHSNFYTKTEVDSALAGKQTTLGYAPENQANRGVANGYASLDSSGLVPVSQLNVAQLGKWVQTTTLGEALVAPGYGSNDTNNFALPGSLSGSYAVMGGRVRFDKRTKIISISWKTNAINGSAAMVIQKDDGIPLGTYPVANGTNIANGINFVCEPGIAYQMGPNNTSNFGNRAERALTQAEINKGFISGCFNNGNFDTTWRLEQVVIQTEEPSKMALSVVDKIQYDFQYTLTSISTASREGVRFTAPYDCTLREVRTHVNATTTSGIILLLDSAGNTLDSKAMTQNTSTVTFSYALTQGTEYRIVVNDTSNWGTTRYYGSVAQFQGAFPYAISGIQGAGAGTVDNTNILNIKYIELDFGGKAYLSKALRGIEAPFCKIDGFIAGPKSKGDSVTLEANKNSMVYGLGNIVRGTLYYLSNTGGALSPTVGTYPVNVGKARTSTDLEITGDGFPIRNTIGDTTVYGGSGVTVYTPISRFVNEGLLMYTLTANTGANNGMQMQWSIDGDRNGLWFDIGEFSGSTLTERRVMVDKGFVRLREACPAGANTASMTIWQ